MFNYCPFVDDRLRQLLREDVMNVHQPVLSTITTRIPNVCTLGNQAMNPNIGHTTIPVNYQTTWSQLVTPIITGKTNVLPISTQLMWYNSYHIR
jgi:hypothetical protein